MSDPVTNVEIEDVLSSIRRLVSAEAQPDRQYESQDDENGAPLADASFVAPKRSEPKLVLTPAQRVNDAEEARIEPAEEAAPEPEAFAEEAEAEAHQPEPEIAEIEDDAQAEDSVAESVEDDAEVEMAEAETFEEPTPMEDSSEEDALEAEISFAEDDVEEAPEQGGSEDETAEQDTLTEDALSFDDMSEAIVPEFLRRPITQMNPPEDAEVLDEAFEDAEHTTAEPEVAEEPVSLTSKLETLEAAVDHQSEDWEPDGGDAESFSAGEVEPLPWNDIELETAELQADTIEHEPLPEPEPAVDETSEAQAPQEAAQEPTKDRATDQDWFGEDALLDEEALRDMVGEIVRQELQGALGERITRNVRKLVRREIHRALMSKGLE